jgi:glycerol-3-phosphate dehydrogenase
MIAYDLLSLDKSLDHHHMLSMAETLARLPGLRAEGLRGACLYYDAQVEYAERLVLENVLSAREHGASVLTYAEVLRFITEEGAVRGVEFRDLALGGLRRARARVTVNVSGPWVDDVLRGALDEHAAKRLIGGTKGSHIVVDDFDGAPKEALYVEAEEDGRPFFIIPWNALYLIGTTDSRYDGDLDAVAADEGEIAYLIRETNRVIPGAKLARASVLYTYSGVRPLAYEEGQTAGAPITRRHFVHDHSGTHEGLLSIVGGKLTTYRNLSEQAVNLIFKKLGRTPVECQTARLPLPGAMTDNWPEFCEQFKAKSPLHPSISDRLLRVYGTRAAAVLSLSEEGADLLEVFSPETGAIGAEVLMSFRWELARTLTDCLFRRTMAGLDRAVGLDAVEGAARIAQKYLGWSQARADQERAAYRKYIERFHPLSLTSARR